MKLSTKEVKGGLMVTKAHVVKLKIHEEADLFVPFDPDQKLLSEEITDYFLRSIQNKGQHKENYAIEIYSDTPVDEESIRQRLRENFCQEKDNINRSLRHYSVKAICLAGLGIIVLAIMFILAANTDSILLEILDIIGWVAVWEATNIVILEAQDLRQLKKRYAALSKAEIVIRINSNDNEKRG